MTTLLSVHWLLLAALWYGIAGLLHDFFVLRTHKGGYDRELLRLLMDGHVLVLSGLILGVCWWMLRTQQPGGALIGGLVALGMLVYCGLIFPFLKSFATIGISLVVLLVCATAWIRLQGGAAV